MISQARAERYAQYRLPYADEAVQAMLAKIGVCDAVVDIGAGPGLLTRHFAGRVRTLYAVEPEPEFRAILERSVSGCVALDAVAEATGLPDSSVDLIVAANAYHRFDPAGALKEFRRILKPGGWLGIVSYQMAPLYGGEVDLHGRFPEWSARVQLKQHKLSPAYLFGDAAPERLTFAQHHAEGWEEFWGAVISCLEAPDETDSWYGEYMAVHRELFERRAVNGVWSFDYATQVLLGQPKYA